MAPRASPHLHSLGSKVLHNLITVLDCAHAPASQAFCLHLRQLGESSWHRTQEAQCKYDLQLGLRQALPSCKASYEDRRKATHSAD